PGSGTCTRTCRRSGPVGRRPRGPPRPPLPPQPDPPKRGRGPLRPGRRPRPAVRRIASRSGVRMYLEHYGLIRAPFEMTPDPAFLFLGEAHQEGLATLVYAVRARKGFVMLTGEVGTGKTTLLHALLSQ